MNPNYYELLEVKENATKKEIKNSYQKIIFNIHPDRQNEENKEDCRKKFNLIQEAFAILDDEKKKGDYDMKLKKEEKIHVHEEIEIEDLRHNEEDQQFEFDCRCSGKIIVSYSSLEDGFSIFPCSSCSINIKVLISN